MFGFSTATLPPPLLSPDGQSLSWRGYVLLVLLSLAFFLPGLTSIPPLDRDEPHFAQASKQMIESGNYVDIRFQQESRYQKPIGIYWLQAASAKLLLSPEHLDAIWAYRVPSLIGATVAVVMTAALGALFFGPMAGFLAALLLAGCVILNVEARLAKTDAALLGCIMVAQYALGRAYVARDQEEKPSWGVAFAFWTAQGIAVLIKGPILPLITLATLLTLRIGSGTVGWFARLRPVTGLIYALLLTAPWFIAISLATKGDFAAQSAGHDLLAKIWQGQHRGVMPPGLHLLAFPLVFFPGSLLALLALPNIWRARREPFVLFCLGWIVPTWIVFELSLTKLPHYVMPTYPAIAMLAAKVMLDGFPALAERRWRWWPPVVVGLWLVLGTGLATGLVLLPYLTDQVVNVSQMIAGILLLAALMTGLMLLPQRNGKGVLMLSAGGLAFIMISFGFTIPSLQDVWLTRRVVQVAESVKPCQRLKLITASYNEPSLVFAVGTDTLTINKIETVADIFRRDRCRLALLDREHKQSFLDEFHTTEPQPVPLATLTGPNIGSGKKVEVTLYRLPAAP